MTAKSDFTEEEWKLVLEGPPSAGLLVITSDRGGSIRESFSMAKAYTEARKQHGDSELLDEIVTAKPETDHTRYKTAGGAQGGFSQAHQRRRRPARVKGDERGGR